jgi:hydrogenase-1 operon protein HyaE
MNAVVDLPDPALDAAPLVCRLAASPGARWVDAAGLEAFLAEPGEQMLFFHGDPVRFPEVLDVAVVLPELRRHFAQRFGIAVVPRADDDRLAARFGVQRRPALVFLRDGRYVDCVNGMLDWQDYLDRLQQVFERPASRPPIALAAATPAPGCH